MNDDDEVRIFKNTGFPYTVLVLRTTKFRLASSIVSDRDFSFDFVLVVLFGICVSYYPNLKVPTFHIIVFQDLPTFHFLLLDRITFTNTTILRPWLCRLQLFQHLRPSNGEFSVLVKFRRILLRPCQLLKEQVRFTNRVSRTQAMHILFNINTLANSKSALL